jgi:predicted RNA-binding protein YlqC (UPF0109 family)
MQGERALLARDVLQAVCAALLADRNSLAVETDMEGLSATVFALRCAPRDKGQLIGRHGKMFGSLLVIVSAIGAVRGEQLSISEVRPTSGPSISIRKADPKFDPNWPKDSVKWLAEAVCSAVFNCKAQASIRPLPRGGCVEIDLPEHKGGYLHTYSDEMAAIRTVFAAIGTNHGCSLIIDFKIT